MNDLIKLAESIISRCNNFIDCLKAVRECSELSNVERIELLNAINKKVNDGEANKELVDDCIAWGNRFAMGLREMFIDTFKANCSVTDSNSISSAMIPGKLFVDFTIIGDKYHIGVELLSQSYDVDVIQENFMILCGKGKCFYEVGESHFRVIFEDTYKDDIRQLFMYLYELAN